MGGFYVRNNKKEEASIYFKKAMERDPNFVLPPEEQFNLGLYLNSTGMWKEAVQEWQKVVDNFPGAEWAATSLYWIGNSLQFRSFDDEGARKAYRKLIGEHPESEWAEKAKELRSY